MKTAPIAPAHVTFGLDDAAPTQTPERAHVVAAPPAAQALLQARQTFIAGNDLPSRWQGRPQFVLLDTAFGLGHHFLATWDAWQRDPHRCTRLHYVALEEHPPLRAHLQRAHNPSPLPLLAAQLLQAWPPLTPNMHELTFAAGQVKLLLVLGHGPTLLPALRARVDAFAVQGLPCALQQTALPALRLFKALGRLAAPGATLASGPMATLVQAGLATAGFATLPASAPAAPAGAVRAVYLPRKGASARQVTQHHPASDPPRTAVVVGAGLAGAAVARALALQGLQVTVLEQAAQAASQGSGNLAGLFHGTVNADDGRHARVHRAAALTAARTYAEAIAAGVPGQQAGLLRLEQRPTGLQGMQALVETQRWPADYVQALSAAAASELAGVPLAWPAWFFPGGGWISPPHWVHAALATPGVRLMTGCAVAQLQRQGTQWQALAHDGRPLAQGDVMVLAHTQAAAAALQRLGHPAWPLEHTRGQVTLLPAPPGTELRVPVAGDGYAVQVDVPGLPQTGLKAGAGLLCGATSVAGLPVAGGLPDVTTEDHLHNLLRLQRLMGASAPTTEAAEADALHSGRGWQGRAAWRLNTNDRLPIAGAVPLPNWPAGQRQDQARLLPREPGLFVLTALGARGLTLAPLLAQLIAAQACGSPWPLEQDLADAVDPARWRVRAARDEAASTAGQPRRPGRAASG